MEFETQKHAILITGILASITAYLVLGNLENTFTGANTLFWILSGMLVVLGQQWIPERRSRNS